MFFLLLLIIIPFKSINSCKTPESTFSTTRAYFKVGALDHLDAMLDSSSEEVLMLMVTVSPAGLLENGGLEWDGEDWRATGRHLKLEVTQEESAGTDCYRTITDPPLELFSSPPLPSRERMFTWFVTVQPCMETRLRLRVTGQLLGLEERVQEDYVKRPSTMGDMSLCQFRKRYLQSFPQVLAYPGKLEAPSRPLRAPVLVPTVLEELTAHLQDENCQGEGCPGTSGNKTVTIKTVEVNWQPVGCAHGFLYNMTSSSGLSHIVTRLRGDILLADGQQRTAVELCHHLPDKALMEFYEEEYKESAAYSCVAAPSVAKILGLTIHGLPDLRSSTPSAAVCGVSRLEVTAWREDTSLSREDTSLSSGREDSSLSSVREDSSLSSGREWGPPGELVVDTCSLQGGGCVREREVTLVAGGGSRYTDRRGSCGEEEDGRVCGAEDHMGC